MASPWKERDIAKKVIVNKYGQYTCPCCKSSDAWDVFCENYPLRRCQNCGQLLDWSDTSWRDYE